MERNSGKQILPFSDLAFCLPVGLYIGVPCQILNSTWLMTQSLCPLHHWALHSPGLCLHSVIVEQGPTPTRDDFILANFIF